MNMEIPGNSTSHKMWDLIWEAFEKASLTYDLVSSQNVAGTNPEDNYSLENAVKLGILTGFFIAFVVDFGITTPKFQLDSCLEAKLKAMMMAIINMISFLLLAPLVLPILTILLIYRKIVDWTLKFQLGDNFAGLFSGTDCVWAVEKSTALSVINVFAVLEKSGTASDNFMEDLRVLIKDRLLSPNFGKLNWLREKKYGHFYWRRDEEIRIEERVRWIDEDDDHKTCDGTCGDINGDFLKTLLTKATNKPLPNGHSVSWEILVCRSCAKSSSRLRGMEEGPIELEDQLMDGKTTIPILFRVHHAVGDGVALLRLLLEAIADLESIKVDNKKLHPKLTCSIAVPEAIEHAEENCLEIRVPILRKRSSMHATCREKNQVLYYGNDLLNASMPFTARIPINALVRSIFSYIEGKYKVLIRLDVEGVKTYIMEMLCNMLEILRVDYLEAFRRKLMKLGEFLGVLLSIPTFLAQQALRSMDNSALHGPSLTGEKIMSFWMESDLTGPQDSNLMSKIRDIKNVSGTRFGDVILAALSANLHRYFLKIGEASPKAVTVVIPARMVIPSQKLDLQNEFSVGLQKLCVAEVNDESVGVNSSEDSRLWDRLNDVSRSSEQLRNDPDYLINFWVMKWLSAALPECLLEPALESHSTMVFSNLPGPQEVSILGYRLKNVVFWIPHRGSTGLGYSLLTYGDKIHFSLVADAAIMRSSKFLDEILHETVKDIEKLHGDLELSCLANLRHRK